MVVMGDAVVMLAKASEFFERPLSALSKAPRKKLGPVRLLAADSEVGELTLDLPHASRGGGAGQQHCQPWQPRITEGLVPLSGEDSGGPPPRRCPD